MLPGDKLPGDKLSWDKLPLSLIFIPDYIVEGFGMENVGIFYDNMVYFTAIWYILWPFGIVCVNWYIFPVLVCLDQEKSGNPAVDSGPLTAKIL
jgi:hypothetical protein